MWALCDGLLTTTAATTTTTTTTVMQFPHRCTPYLECAAASSQEH